MRTGRVASTATLKSELEGIYNTIYGGASEDEDTVSRSLQEEVTCPVLETVSAGAAVAAVSGAQTMAMPWLKLILK